MLGRWVYGPKDLEEVFDLSLERKLCGGRYLESAPSTEVSSVT